MISRLSPAVAARLASVLMWLGIFCAHMPAQSASQPRTDDQVWTDVQFALSLTDKTDLVMLGILRFGRNFSHPVSERIGVGVARKIGKYLTVSPSFLYSANQPTSTNHSTEERITLDASAKIPIGRFTLSDRNRVDFHFHSPPPNYTQYRNRLQVAHPFHFSEHELEGFVADEIFYDSIARAWIRNRFYLGGSKKLNRHLTLELYYLRQNDSRSHQGDINAVGTSFKFRK